MNTGLFSLAPRRASTDTQHPGGVMPAGYMTSIIPNQNASMSFVSGREFIIPISLWVPHRIHYLGMAIVTVGTESAVLHMGIRPLMNDGFPGQLLSSGTVDCTASTGTGTKWVPQNGVELPPGRYCICTMANGWTTTAPVARAATAGAGDQQSYGYFLPLIGPVPQTIATALPGAGNPGLMTGFRNGSTSTPLPPQAMRDWSANTNVPAMYVQGEPLL